MYALGACALWGLAFVAPAAGGVGGIGPAPVSLIFGALPIIMTAAGNLRRR